MRKNDSITGSFDWILFGLYIVLVVFGISTIYSVTYNPENPSIFSFSEMYGRQVFWVGVSLFLGLLVFLIDSDIYRKFSIPIYLFCVSLLVIVLFMPPINGARAWLGFGSFGIQPGEFAKIGTAILLSSYMSSFNVKQQNGRTVLVSLAIIIVPMLLIILQPDAGTFVVFTAFFFVMYREGLTFDPIVLKIVNAIPGVKFRSTWLGTHFIPILFVVVFLLVITLIIGHEPLTFDAYPGEEFSGYWRMFAALFITAILGYLIMRSLFPKREARRAFIITIIGFSMAVGITAPVHTTFKSLPSHQKTRIELWLGIYEAEEGTGNVTDGADYNRFRAMTAVGSGGFTGKGYREANVATTKTNHVPECETDFIFSPWAEERGFLGSIFLVVVYIFLLLRVIAIAERQRSKYNRVYAYSVAMILFYHFAVNVGMNIGLVPIIGIPLPLFSYGGSSMMAFSIMIFLLLKLDSQRKDVLN
ncbi:MAG: rod shape-determining protein RodA [Crocinitomicaceae bacterium]|nr:rod shape-determining protein RodA [Crocinitomicaceae bacterium]